MMFRNMGTASSIHHEKNVYPAYCFVCPATGPRFFLRALFLQMGQQRLFLFGSGQPGGGFCTSTFTGRRVMASSAGICYFIYGGFCAGMGSRFYNF